MQRLQQAGTPHSRMQHIVSVEWPNELFLEWCMTNHCTDWEQMGKEASDEDL